ncbi:MAG: DUF5011 domain-containing protein, partial [Candidatus Wolfebacteria bacterium]|nr:DUF5011 domain-containing protein [Candidatus Wolfebacteria bacterium]
MSLPSSLVIVEDSISPNTPNISTPNQTVNAATKTINGTAEAGSLITANGGAEIATSTATTGGSFSIVVKLTQNEANVLSLTATDAAGNESAADTVTITEDSIAPTAPTVTTLPQTIDADSIVIEGTAEPEAYILIAIYGGAETVSDRAEIDGSFAIDIPLTQDALNHLLVTAADAVNNTSPTTSVDITEDGTPPVITLTGNNPEIVEVHSVYIDAGATALDSVAGDLTLSITASSNVNTAVLGEYAVTYNVSDTAGNLTSSSRVVNVVDTTAPVITLIGSSTVTIEVGNAYVDAGATASDNYDLDITANITSSSDVNTALLGSYSVVFSVSDSSGNMASTTRIVEVVDTTSPVLTLTGANPQTIEGGNAYIELGATASDNYDNDISASITVTTSSINT